MTHHYCGCSFFTPPSLLRGRDALLAAHAYRVLIGACNPIVCSIHGADLGTFTSLILLTVGIISIIFPYFLIVFAVISVVFVQ